MKSPASVPPATGLGSRQAGALTEMTLQKRGWPIMCCILILTAALAGLALRLPRLDQRPMHTDEAVHAIKLRYLLEDGVYIYDPNEFHGPTLNYLTLIPARLASAEKLTETSEFTLRIVTVFFGTLLILLLLLMADGLGPGTAVYAAILTAVSPAMVFYSRYYIQETLLVCFSFGAIACGYRYYQNKDTKWALLTGIFLGLMHATKETCIIAFGSMLLALLFTLLLHRRQQGCVSATIKAVKPRHLIAMLTAAAAVSALFYSSFLTNPNGILDSFRAYTNYFSRAGSNALHIHPWYYYLKMLIYSRYGAGPIWTEGPILLLALVGFIVTFRTKGLAGVNSNLLRFIAFYTLIMIVVYSTIPYKTPWSMLGFLHGLILLAAVGAVALIRVAPNVLPRLIIICLLIVAPLHLTWQAYLGSYRFYADSCNPYVYAHPTTDVLTMVQRVEQIAQVHEDGHNMEIHFICPDEHDFWPFPWYLRSFSKVGHWKKVTDNAVSASLIIASANVEQELLTKLYELPPPGRKRLYVPLFDKYMELRPQVELRGYVTKELWDRFQQNQAQSD